MDLAFPFDAAPAHGEVVTVAPGVSWARLALPFRLDHVNVYIVEDDRGFAIVDTGISDRPTRAAWEALIDGPFRGAHFTQIIVTHHHPDHIGMAGWLCERLDAPLLISRTGWLSAMNFYNSPELLEASAYSRFYTRHGLAEEVAALVSTRGHEYLRMLSKPPFTFRQLVAGETLMIGGRGFEIMIADGHCAGQVMLHLREENLFLAADQVIEKITPNISVMAFEPEGNPLGAFLASLETLSDGLPDDVLVLSGHRMPFTGLRTRCATLAAHHEDRCATIAEASSARPVTAAELVPILFPRRLTPHEMSFAFSEVLAHMNLMIVRGELMTEEGADDRVRVRRT